MLRPVLAGVRRLVSLLVDPWRAMGAAGTGRGAGAGLAVLGAGLAALGAATLPRQVDLVHRLLPRMGGAAADGHAQALREGVIRLMVVDRLVPNPTLLVAAVLLALAAEPMLGLADDRRRAIWQVTLLGLTPLLVQRVGELLVTYLVPAAAFVTPGDAVGAPQRFATGPRLLWSGAVAPRWAEVLEPRLNLVVLWVAGLWAVGLARLEGGRVAPWHVALALACVAVAGAATWAVAPVALAVVLGRP